MTDPGVLPDTELMTRAHRWRYEAMHGDSDARHLAKIHEAEVRRRFGGAKDDLQSRRLRSKPWWKFW